jgi:hypothetical protein
MLQLVGYTILQSDTPVTELPGVCACHCSGVNKNDQVFLTTLFMRYLKTVWRPVGSYALGYGLTTGMMFAH